MEYFSFNEQCTNSSTLPVGRRRKARRLVVAEIHRPLKPKG